MKSLLIYLKNYKKECVLAPLFKMLEATFELFVPLVVKLMIDEGIGNNDKNYVMKMAVMLVFLAIIGLVASITAQFYSAKAATGFSSELRHTFFKRIQELTFSQTDKFGTDTLITRITSDINQVQNGVNLVLRLFLRSPFIVIGAMIMAFRVDTKAALIFAVTIPVLSIVVFGIMLITIPLYKSVQNKLEQIMTSTRENLIGVRVIRAFHREEDEIRRFKDNNDNLSMAQKFVGKISGLMNPVTFIIVNGATMYLIYAGALRVEVGILTQGAVIALLNYMSQILVELIKLANLIIQVSKAWASGDRIAEVLNVVPDMEDGSETEITDADTSVIFDNVSLRYAGSAGYALENISFTAKKGQVIGIIGGTGSGKSSLINLIPRFYDATEGSVKAFGRDVREYKVSSLRDFMGIVPQKTELFKGTIAENLRWGNKDATEEDFEEALEISQAKEYVEQKPGKTEYKIEQKGRNLSGGQKQRLTIARAIMKKPKILILDDSASALDFATDARLRMAIRGMSKDLTTFIVSQRAASVQYADQIIVLDDGKLVGLGTHEVLMQDNKVYREIYLSQFPDAESERGKEA